MTRVSKQEPRGSYWTPASSLPSTPPTQQATRSSSTSTMRGQLVGAYDLDSHGYLQDRHGNFTTIDHPDTVVSTGEPIGINNRGQIVGNYIDSDGKRQELSAGQTWLHDHRCSGRPGHLRHKDQRSRADRRHLQHTQQPDPRSAPRLSAGRWRLHHDRCPRRPASTRLTISTTAARSSAST